MFRSKENTLGEELAQEHGTQELLRKKQKAVEWWNESKMPAQEHLLKVICKGLKAEPTKKPDEKYNFPALENYSGDTGYSPVYS